MKKLFVVALILIFVLSLLGACGDGGSGGGESGGGGASAPVATTGGSCPCYPGCGVAACENGCDEKVCDSKCKHNDGSYDCEEGKCCTVGGGSFTFLVEIDTNFTGSLGEGNRTLGKATVTLDDFDGSGWFGSAEGVGEYTTWTLSGFELLEYDIGYDFTVKLSDFDPQKGDGITIGIDRFCSETESWKDTEPNSPFYGEVLEMPGAIMMSFDYWRTDLIDEETGLYTFKLPMENGIAKLIDHWKEPPPGLIVIDMTITVTQL